MYCNMVWCAAFQTVLRPLEVVQKKALKMALNKPKDTSTELVFQLAKVHDLKTIHKIQTAIFMYKYNNMLLPRGFSDKFVTNEKYHCYSTRMSQLYHVPKIRLLKTKFSVHYRGVIVWNSLSENLRNAESLQVFKTMLKTVN